MVPCFEAARVFPHCNPRFEETDRRIDGSCNTRRDLVLKFEDIRQVAVISLSPYVRTALNADQLGGNANSIASGTDTPFDDVVRLEFSTHLRDVNCHPFVGER